MKNECQGAGGVYGVLLPIGSFVPDTVPTIDAVFIYIRAAELRSLFSIKLQTLTIMLEAIVKYAKRGTLSFQWIPVVPRYVL